MKKHGELYLRDIATGVISWEVRQVQDGARTYDVNWEGGPFAVIERTVWHSITPEVGERKLNRARLGIFEMVLMEDDPREAWEIWYCPAVALAPTIPQMGGAPCA